MNKEEYLSEEELHTIPLNWWEELQLLREQQRAAKRAFFSHNWDGRWQELHYLSLEHRSELLVCDWCSAEATHYQTRPGKALFCNTCTKELRKYRRSVFLKNKRWKEEANARAMLQVGKRE
jgi:hypothetical protein